MRRAEVAEHIRSAKEDGDVTENAAYDYAKEEQAFLFFPYRSPYALAPTSLHGPFSRSGLSLFFHGLFSIAFSLACARPRGGRHPDETARKKH